MKSHHWLIILVVIAAGVVYVAHMKKSHKGESIIPSSITGRI